MAASLVFAHHLGVASYAASLRDAGHAYAAELLGGLTASGVELFFVLSAIVLAGPYVKDGRPMNLRVYASRRFFRLMPPYLAAWLMAGTAIGLATAFPTWWTVGANLPAFSMIDWISHVFIVYSGRHYNFAWWSLSVEVAFYALLPLAIPIFARLSGSQLWIALAISVGAAILLSPHVTLSPVAQSFVAYASCFCAGLVLARRRIGSRTSFALVVAGVIWMLVASGYRQFNMHVGWGAIYMGLVAIAMDPATPLSKALSNHGFVWLGERSYSFFLVHYSVIGLVCHAASFAIGSKTLGYFVITRALSVVLTMAATIAVFHFVERRFAHGLQTGADVLPWRLFRTLGVACKRKVVRPLRAAGTAQRGERWVRRTRRPGLRDDAPEVALVVPVHFAGHLVEVVEIELPAPAGPLFGAVVPGDDADGLAPHALGSQADQRLAKASRRASRS
jgi:peptidoglycan/LPS O-acetylase OafA/YrhL